MKNPCQKTGLVRAVGAQSGQLTLREKEVFRFDGNKDANSECDLLAGEVVVETPNGERVAFGAGDFVTFPQDLSRVWDVRTPVRKHYRFRSS